MNFICRTKNRLVALLCITLLSFCFYFYLTSNWPTPVIKNCKINRREYENNLVKVKKYLAVAHRYARSGKTMMEIRNAFSVIESILNEEEYQLKELPQYPQSNVRKSNSSQKKPEVCPEKYLGRFVDYPAYNRGFETVSCDRESLDKTISFVAITDNCLTAKKIVKNIIKNNPNVKTIIGVARQDTCELPASLSSFKTISFKSGIANDADNWINLIKETSSKYVLIIRDVFTFNNESNIERLIRVISDTGIEAVGGSQRYEDGRWFSGCYQMSMKNYTLRLIEGYDISHSSCMYCDYLSTSFLSLRSTLLDTLKAGLKDRAVFVDFFLTLFKPDRIGAMACPDVMFSSVYNDLNVEPRSTWQQVAKVWELTRFILPNNSDIWFSCEESSIKCRKKGGEVVPLCCLKKLSDGLKFLLKTSQDRDVDIGLICGTLIGSLKFYGSLPWERDHDIDFPVTDTSKLKALQSFFAEKGYNIEFSMTYYDFKGNEEECVKKGIINCNYFGFTFDDWRIELTGTSFPVWYLKGEYNHSTRILFDGLWVNTYTNPGHSMRVYVGGDLLQHIEHHGTLKKPNSVYTKLRKGSFLPCERPMFHGCLSNFLPDGNIQFKDIWI